MHECLYVGLPRVRNSADIIILTTEDKVCPYKLRARAVNVVYGVVRLTITGMRLRNIGQNMNM